MEQIQSKKQDFLWIFDKDLCICLIYLSLKGKLIYQAIDTEFTSSKPKSQHKLKLTARKIENDFNCS